MPQLVDLRGDVETRHQESLHEEGSRSGSESSQKIRRVHLGFPQGRQATAGDNGRRVSGDSVDWGPPLTREAWRRMWGWYREAVDHAPPPVGVTLEWITKDCEELYHAVPPPAGDNHHIRTALPNRRLLTYRGGGRVGGKETTGTPIGRPLPDVRQAPPGVDTGAQRWRSGEGKGEGGRGGGRGISVEARVRI